MRRLTVVLLALCAVLGVTACKPRPASGPATRVPPNCWKHPGGYPGYPEVARGILEAFGHLGQHVVDEAGRVACCESGWGPGAPNGGLFQITPNGYGTVRFYSAKRFGYGTFAIHDIWVNSQSARDFYTTRGHNWSAFACRP